MTASKPAACAACTRAELSGSTRLDAMVHGNRALLARVARSEGLAGEDVFDAVQEAFSAFLTRVRPRAAPVGTDAAEGGTVGSEGAPGGGGETDAAPVVASSDAERRTLVALTRNIARNRRRLHATARPHDGDDATLAALPAGDDVPEDQLLRAEQHARLACCVGRLADIQRAVVTLRMLDELPGRDVARQLGVTPGHVAVLLHRAKSALATCLSEES
jgi:RNA polymerase sigma-70 factor (ECF subfamily)